MCAEAVDNIEGILDLVPTGLDEVSTSCCLIITCISYLSTRSKTLSFALYSSCLGGVFAKRNLVALVLYAVKLRDHEFQLGSLSIFFFFGGEML